VPSICCSEATWALASPTECCDSIPVGWTDWRALGLLMRFWGTALRVSINDGELTVLAPKRQGFATPSRSASKATS
jgi:hypothetical protein